MRYKPLLVCAFIITALWLVRCIFASNFGYYGFITGNIFLASIPLLLQPAFRQVRKKLKGVIRTVAQALLCIFWILFMPNAFYILTDFMHLNSSVLVNMRGNMHHFGVSYARGDGLYLLDSLLLLMATVYGGYVGGLALRQGYMFLRIKLSVKLAIVFTGWVMLLSAIGVYIGRFGRWNSWEGLIKPWQILSDLITSLSNSAIRERFALVIITIILFQCICLFCINYAHHLRPQQ